MKKTYLKPTTNMTLIKMEHQLLAGSYSVSNTEATGDALSRDGGYWDDED